MDDPSVGERMKRLRERKAWTQEQLAATSGVSVRTVQRAEEGVMSADTLGTLAAALGVPVDALSWPARQPS